MGSKFWKMVHRLEDSFAVLAGILLFVSALSVTAEIIVRYFFNFSFVWTQELNQYILLYIPFLAGAWLLRQQGHVTVDIINNLRVGQKYRRGINLIVAVIGILVTAILVYFGITTTIDVFVRNVRSITPLAIPQAYIYIIIPIGSLLMLLEFIKQCLSELTDHQPIEK